MTTIDAVVGANEFTFKGDRTTITYFPETPGPVVVGHEGGELRYQGPEGDLTFYGPHIIKTESPLGLLLTVIVRPNIDAGAKQVTVVVPNAIGVTMQAPVTFATVAIRSTTRGFVAGPGVDRTYDLLPLIGQAAEVILPLV